MKPTHAQLVNLLREIVCASPQVQPWLIERARQVLCLRDAALAPPPTCGTCEQLRAERDEARALHQELMFQVGKK